jgi:hypothetical protein
MGRKAALYIETVYNAINLVFSWFGLANYLIFVCFPLGSMPDVELIAPSASSSSFSLPPSKMYAFSHFFGKT